MFVVVYLPSFLPGASLKRRAERERDSLRMLSDWPYEEALKKRVRKEEVQLQMNLCGIKITIIGVWTY